MTNNNDISTCEGEPVSTSDFGYATTQESDLCTCEGSSEESSSLQSEEASTEQDGEGSSVGLIEASGNLLSEPKPVEKEELDLSKLEFGVFTRSIWGRASDNKSKEVKSLDEAVQFIHDNINGTTSATLTIESEQMSKMQCQIYLSGPNYRVKTNLKYVQDVGKESLADYIIQNVLDHWLPPPKLIEITKEQILELQEIIEKNSHLEPEELRELIKKERARICANNPTIGS